MTAARTARTPGRAQGKAATSKRAAPKKAAPKKAAPKKAAPKKAAPKKAAPKKAARGKAPAKKARASVAQAESPSARRATPQERIDALTRVFTALGARKPEVWARAHVETGSDEIGRFVFLRALWMRVVEPGRALAQVTWDPAAAAAFDRMLKAGISLADLDAVVRFAQRGALEDVCRVIDDPIDREEGIRWGLFRLDSDGAPLWELSDLTAGLATSEP